jgi:uncharacterized membrane protein
MTTRGSSRTQILVLGSVLLLLAVSSAAQTFQFVSIDYPNAISTVANGINPQGSIAGTYLDSSGNQHAFVLNNERFTSFDFPGSVSTNARGINAAGQIVGSYVAPPGATVADIKGFLYSRGQFSTVLFPGHPGAIPQRISSTGDIYGCYHDYDLMASMHGFARTRSGYINVDEMAGMPVPASMNNGATPPGTTVIGLFTDMTLGKTRGYVVQDRNFEPFDVPGSVSTSAWDINSSGIIVGVFRDSAARKVHGFVRNGDAYAQIDYPGALATQAFGINPGGAIVGQYTDNAGNTHGFLAIPANQD